MGMVRSLQAVGAPLMQPYQQLQAAPLPQACKCSDIFLLRHWDEYFLNFRIQFHSNIHFLNNQHMHLHNQCILLHLLNNSMLPHPHNQCILLRHLNNSMLPHLHNQCIPLHHHHPSQCTLRLHHNRCIPHHQSNSQLAATLNPRFTIRLHHRRHKHPLHFRNKVNSVRPIPVVAWFAVASQLHKSTI